MDDDWDFYFGNVEGTIASFFVNLALRCEAPLRNLPCCGHIRITMLQPREDGLSSSEEFQTLCQIEDEIKNSLCDSELLYVGRCTGGGVRDFFFYLADPAHWRARVASTLKNFQGYQFQAGSREDPDWDCYFSYLLPDDLEMQGIRNRRVCQSLEEHGDQLVELREIDHFCYFPSESARQAFLDEVLVLGYEIRELNQSDSCEDLPYLAHLCRNDIPSYEGIDSITLPLFKAARKHQGDYDGWGCTAIN